MIHCAHKVAESLEEVCKLLEASHEYAYKKARFYRTSLLGAQQPCCSTYLWGGRRSTESNRFQLHLQKKTGRYLSESIIDKIHDNRKSWIITYINSVNGYISAKIPFFHSTLKNSQVAFNWQKKGG